MASGLVSCILPTRDRRGFFQQALRCFLHQTWPDRELIVVDDGEQPVGDLCAGLPGVSYIRCRRPITTGAKLNLGIDSSRGAIIQKLDDDDYYHPGFLKRAVSRLPSRPSERSLVAWCCFLTLRAGDLRVRHSRHGWTAGGTFCFYRKLWERRPFRRVWRAVDGWFLEDHRPRVIRVCASELYLLVRHGGNTWTHMSDGVTADAYLSEPPVYGKPLAQLVDARALQFYRSLRRTPR